MDLHVKFIITLDYELFTYVKGFLVFVYVYACVCLCVYVFAFRYSRPKGYDA